MTSDKQHWDRVHAGKPESQVSWFQEHPTISLELISRHVKNLASPIIDVGGGASRLIDELVARGYGDLTVLDIASHGLERAKERLGDDAKRVAWIVADVTDWRPHRAWGLWHDRAVFHFLVEPADQNAYIAAMVEATTVGSITIIATFALDGPEQCSGLPTQRYDADGLARRIGPPFALIDGAGEKHETPGGAVQAFTYAVLERV